MLVERKDDAFFSTDKSKEFLKTFELQSLGIF